MDSTLDNIRHYRRWNKGTSEVCMQKSLHLLQVYENDAAVYGPVQMSVFTWIYGWNRVTIVMF